MQTPAFLTYLEKLPDTGWLLLDGAVLENWEITRQYPLLAEAPAELDNKQGMMPQLLNLAALDAKQRHHMQAVADEYSPFGEQVIHGYLVASPAAGKSIVQHWAQHLVLQHPQASNTGKVFWRFYDARVLQHLRWILTPEQLNTLLGKAFERWYYPDNVGDGVYQPTAETTVQSLSLEQLQRIAVIAELNACLQQWADPPMASLPIADKPPLVTALCNALVRAQQHYRLKTADERGQFALDTVGFNRKYAPLPTQTTAQFDAVWMPAITAHMQTQQIGYLAARQISLQQSGH